MDRGAWKAAVHGVVEGQTRLSDFTFTFHFHALETEMAPAPPGIALPLARSRGVAHFHPLEKEMATHSSILVWRISMYRGAWWAIVHRVAQSWT